MSAKNIVLIHGNFINDHAWHEWIPYLEERGYRVHAPANPGHNGIPSALRDSEHPELGDTGIVEIVNRAARLIDGLPEKPLVIGHSLGGLAALKLVDLGKCSAAVSLHGAPPKNGPLVPLQTLWSVLPAFGLLTTGRTWLGTPAWYDRTFFNCLPASARADAYERYAVRESKKAMWSGLLDPMASVDFAKARVPLLFVGGTADNIFPASFTRRIASYYPPSAGVVDIEIFEGRSHFTAGDPGWEAVADSIVAWHASRT